MNNNKINKINCKGKNSKKGGKGFACQAIANQIIYYHVVHIISYKRKNICYYNVILWPKVIRCFVIVIMNLTARIASTLGEMGKLSACF